MDTISMIQQFSPRTGLQGKSKELILRELHQYGDRLYLRDTLHAHMTASAIILNQNLDKTLMVYHNIYNSYSWTGGHADGERNLYEVAYNEAREETGVAKLYPVSGGIMSVECLQVKEHKKKGQKVSAHYHYNVTFGFICPENQPLKVKPDENSSVAWLNTNELAQFCVEKEMLPIYMENIKQMLIIMKEKEKVYALLPAILLPWYEKNARDLPWRKDQAPYHVWLSEIMLQQTRVDTVIDYYNRFLKEFPTIEALAGAGEEKVLKLWEGLGYYSRARNLQKAAQTIMAEYDGRFPGDPAEISKLSGVGSYTTGAIASICFGRPVPAVDGNVLRVISRLTEDYRCTDEEATKKEISKQLAAIYPKGRCGDFTQSLMELGATVCLPNGEPLCASCPAREICAALKNQTYPLLPVRKEKKSRHIQPLTLFILQWEDKTAVQKRREKGVLHQMWEFPNAGRHLDEPAALKWLHEQGGSGAINHIEKGKHIFTHIEWQMLCYTISCKKPFGTYLWADKNKMDAEISLPTAFKKFLKRD